MYIKSALMHSIQILTNKHLKISDWNLLNTIFSTGLVLPITQFLWLSQDQTLRFQKYLHLRLRINKCTKLNI